MKRISKKTISRVILYMRTLEDMIKSGKNKVSSAELADLTGLTDVQIRKDISSFGKVGTPRIGYDTTVLKNTLENFVLHEEVLHIAVFGAGNLGTAIMRYPGFGKGKIKIVAAFDNSIKRIGKKINGVEVFSVERVSELLNNLHVDLGVIAVPGEYSQAVADMMVSSGLKAIVNFSTVSISVPRDVWVRTIDLSLEFLSIYCETQVAGLALKG